MNNTNSSDSSGSPKEAAKKPKPPVKKKKRKFLRFLLKAFLLLFFLGGIVGISAGYFIYKKYSEGLPDVRELKDYKPSLPTFIYSDKDEKIGEFYIERRILVPIDEMPAMMIQASIAVEDSNFFSHGGIDYLGIIRAGIKNFLAGHVVEGGSTITQQLAKTMFLSPERNIERKIREAILAISIERNFTKNEILEIYLNQIYYGHGAYGVEAAAQTYFGKHINELDISEMALIASLPRAPRNYSPYLNPERAMNRRNHALRRLAANNFISEKEAQEAALRPFNLGDRESFRQNQAPYFIEYVRRYIEDKYGSTKLYRSGFHVYTTLNQEYQKKAQMALFQGLRTDDKRYGFRGPIIRAGSPNRPAGYENGTYSVGQVVPFPWEQEKSGEDNSLVPGKILVGSVTEVKPDKAQVSLGFISGEIALKDMDWARKPNPNTDGLYAKISNPLGVLKAGDIIEVRVLPKEKGGSDRLRLALEQEPEVQGALLALDPPTGQIKAMVGGYDYKKSQFNRATQATRQPGSAFKPIIYTTALEKGYTPATIVLDSPVIYNETEVQKFKWKPENFEEKFYGPTRIREAVAHSRNLVTIKVLKDIGVQDVVAMAKRLGIDSPLEADLSLALGSSGLTLWELISVYSAFANGGLRMEPYGVRYIKNRDGDIVEERRPQGSQVISPEIAYSMVSILKSVIEEGTGKTVSSLGRPVAGKTGTTNNYIDAWFMGFTTEIATGVWVGKDDNKPLGKLETGARAASPIWLDFMETVEKDKPVHDFPVPPNIIFKKIDPKSGLLANFGKPYLFECFLGNSAPVQYAPAEDKKEDFPNSSSPL
ncbi:MAG: PBP1A family penicillin-binding protein [Nitrospinae bacterium]|nr:PBP1A family penicillin-binding protein [Nitrospinota bacterium]